MEHIEIEALTGTRANPMLDDVVGKLVSVAGTADDRLAQELWNIVRPQLARDLVAGRKSMERSDVHQGEGPKVAVRLGLVVVGHTAVDRLINFRGLFSEQHHQDRHTVLYNSTSQEVVTRRGGIGANIAYGAALLGLRPTLVSAVGAEDGRELVEELAHLGVDTKFVVRVPHEPTPRFSSIIDQGYNQLAVFEDSISERQTEVDLRSVVADVGNVGLLVITSNPASSMLRTKRQALALGLRHVLDPSARLRQGDIEPSTLRELLEHSHYVIAAERDYERMIASTGWDYAELLRRAGTLVCTSGSRDVVIDRDGQQSVKVPVAVTRNHADPTGASDAFRAGFVSGLALGLSDADAARIGCVLASAAYECVGTQEYEMGADDLVKRLAESYGDEVADRVQAALPPQ